MYWEKSGRDKTEDTLQVASDRLEGSEIENVVVASNRGNTVKKFSEIVNEIIEERIKEAQENEK